MRPCLLDRYWSTSFRRLPRPASPTAPQLTWVKHHFVIGMADYHHRYEPILYGWLPDAAHYFTDDRTQDDVFEFDKPQTSEFHPTTKPVELVARMILNSSRGGEVVYDPFCGSGSTLLAAHQLGRIGYGVDISSEYLAVALERYRCSASSRSWSRDGAQCTQAEKGQRWETDTPNRGAAERYLRLYPGGAYDYAAAEACGISRRTVFRMARAW